MSSNSVASASKRPVISVGSMYRVKKPVRYPCACGGRVVPTHSLTGASSTPPALDATRTVLGSTSVTRTRCRWYM
jgi:hypothetical protein